MTKIIWVKWEDATGSSDSYNDDDFDGKFGRSLMIESAGILVRDDEESIVITQDTWRGEQTGKTIRRTPLSIPKAYIREKKIWDLNKKVRSK